MKLADIFALFTRKRPPKPRTTRRALLQNGAYARLEGGTYEQLEHR